MTSPLGHRGSQSAGSDPGLILGKQMLRVYCRCELVALLFFLCCQEVRSSLLRVLRAHNAGPGTGGDRPHRGPGPGLPRAVLPL